MNEQAILDPAQSKPLGPLSIAFRYVLRRVMDYSTAGLLDEETLTSSILGGLGVALPLVAEVYGSGSSGAIENVSWGSYNKSARRTNPGSEAASGADFAMVLWESATVARIAVFQAKKGVTVPTGDPKKPRWMLDVHRKPPKRTERAAQLPMLIATGVRAGMPPKPDGSRVSTSDLVEELRNYSYGEKIEILAQLHWIHYLVYWNDCPLCLSLCDIPPAIVERELDQQNTLPSLVVMPSEKASFFNLIQSGLEKEVVTGWLSLDKGTLEALLPDLLDLMPVYVGDEGKGGPRLVAEGADYSVEVVGAVPSTAAMIELMEKLIDPEGPGSSLGMKP